MKLSMDVPVYKNMIKYTLLKNHYNKDFITQWWLLKAERDTYQIYGQTHGQCAERSLAFVLYAYMISMLMQKNNIMHIFISRFAERISLIVYVCNMRKVWSKSHVSTCKIVLPKCLVIW